MAIYSTKPENRDFENNKKEWKPGEKITGNYAADVLKEYEQKHQKVIDPLEKLAMK